MNLEQIDTSTTAGKIHRLLCAIRGHAGIGSNGRCKKCRSEVDCLPREWRKSTMEQSMRSQSDGLKEVWVVYKGDIPCMGPFGDEQLAIDRAQDAGAAYNLVKYIRADLAGEVP